MIQTGVVLTSGGLDSTVVASIAVSECIETLFVTFDYGQRHGREIEAARAVSAHFGSEQIIATLNADAWGGSALTDPSQELELGRDIGDSIPATYVPARNLIFLSVALGIAEAREADAVYIGVNSLDYSGYPDCRPEFIASFERTGELALKRGVEGNPVKIMTPLIAMTKAEIVAEAIRTGAPIELTWSCYAGGSTPCGLCDSCNLRARGFAEAGVVDPALSRG